MSEAQLQRHVEAAAKQLGWRTYHTRYSLRSERGFPDLVLIRDGRLLAIELKRDDQYPTPEQDEWLFAFGQVPGCEAFVWRPIDWRSDAITEALR